MKKTIRIAAALAAVAAVIIFLIIWNARAAAARAVEAYNGVAESFNGQVAPYNEAAAAIAEANGALQDVLDEAQGLVDRAAPAYEPDTLGKLQKAVGKAREAMVPVPVQIEPFALWDLPSGFDKKALDALRQEAEAAKMAAEEARAKIPPVPQAPDYTEETKSVRSARKAYADSVQKLANVTAPSTDFVRSRLGRVGTVTAAEAVTDQHDPNGLLGRPGGYLGCVYFRDSRVARDLLPEAVFDGKKAAEAAEAAASIEEADAAGTAVAAQSAGTGASAADERAAEDAAPAEWIDIIEAGTDAGGAVEIYATPEEARARMAHIAFFDGSVMAAGSYAVEGTCLIRTSRYLDQEQQEELTERIRAALLSVDGA